jgi:ribosomal protein S18 acetylase RimI-like enzyme
VRGIDAEDIMTIEIKILNHGDVNILKKVDPDVFDDPIDILRAIEFLGDPRHYLGAAIDGDLVVGFVSAVHYVHPDKPHPELWINEIGVAVNPQRQGIGKHLMNAIFAVGRELNCESAWVLTERDNTAAMNLYAAVGNPDPPTNCVMFSFDLDRSNSVDIESDRVSGKNLTSKIVKHRYENRQSYPSRFQ